MSEVPVPAPLPVPEAAAPPAPAPQSAEPVVASTPDTDPTAPPMEAAVGPVPETASPTATPEAATPAAAEPATPPAKPAAPVKVDIDVGRIAQDLQIRKTQVEQAIHLLEEGLAVPFIAHYRRERVGGLTSEQLRQVQRRLQQQKLLAERKQTVLRNIQALGKLTDELQHQIIHADTARRLEDLYLPFKPRRKSFAQSARDKGVEGLAQAIWSRDPAVATFAEMLPTFVAPERGLNSPEDVEANVRLLLAEMLAEAAAVRDGARRFLWETAKLTTAKAEGVAENVAKEFKDYHQFTDAPRHLAPHRILAINRAEKAKAITVKLDYNIARLLEVVRERLHLADHPHAALLESCLETAVTQVLVPALDREMRRDLTEKAEEHAIHLVARNLRRLLLQPTFAPGKIMAIHPAYKGGCRLVILDEHGQPLDHRAMHLVELAERPGKKDKAKGETATSPAPTPPAAEAAPEMPATEPPAASTSAEATAPAMPAAESATEAPAPAETEAPATPPSETTAAEAAAPPEPPAPPAPPVPTPAERLAEAKNSLAAWVSEHQCAAIALGHGLGYRELEEFLGSLLAEKLPDLHYYVVTEAGINQYIFSTGAREELPNLDPPTRGAAALGRRLLDPLAEFVKVDPVALSVGLHHNDLPEKRLKEALTAEVEDCVNLVGVDVNRAAPALLRFVAGLNPILALAIVQHRQQHGPFASREALKSVADVPEAAMNQALGILRVQAAAEPFDRTPIHPTDYDLTRRLLERAGTNLEELFDAGQRAAAVERVQTTARDAALATAWNCTPAHLQELATLAARIGVDPREQEPRPLAKKGLLRIEELREGQELRGVVQNVVDFGAFIDIGLKDSGLVHISQLANRFIKSPYDLVAVGDVVTVWVLNMDHERKRVSLTMIPPGTERKPPERKPPERRPPRERRETPKPANSEADAKSKLFAPQVATPDRKAPPMQPPPPRPEPSERPPRGPAGKGGPPARMPVQRKERPKPPPKLSSEALQGATPLRTFGELKALYEAKKPKGEETPGEARGGTEPPAPPPTETPEQPPS
ncbi:MAG TPA: Tex-like N-terminal domain-containing protein [Gemmatales bacterium]|nr:Tex-like N-terminal domain-containing protein [Gemmatales bacterium]